MRGERETMIISSQGFGHFTQGLNNQDFALESPRMLLVLDGCSGAKYSEIGTRLFAQLFSRKEEWDSVEKFEDNVKSVFDEIVAMMERYYPVRKELEEEFIMENLLFTIIACFKTESQYIVKLFGDGYVITQNSRNHVSYIKFAYGKCPPYFAYKYCNLQGLDFSNYEFKTFYFDRSVFQNVAIATDGVMPIVKEGNKMADKDIVSGKKTGVQLAIQDKRQSFSDDVTIASFGGEG